MTDYRLDTHTFLWSILESNRLSLQVHSILSKYDNTIYVSSVTFWDISLKFALGKLELEPYTPEELITAANKVGFKTLCLEAEEAANFYQLPKMLHKEPFDRMLIWQAISKDLIFLSKDAQFGQSSEYGLKTLW